MNKRYQVFVSSTYEDLKEERKAVMDCLLDWDCIPVGMEQFPASALSQWDYIKNEIDRSDCYLLIVAGKYGSIDPESEISYTEKEYDYANNKGIPILNFLYEDIGKLNADKVDRDRAQIEKFREKIKAGNRLVDFYSTIDGLKYNVAHALKNITGGSQAISGVREDKNANDNTEEKISNEEIYKMFNDNTNIILLSDEAKKILVEVAKDSSGCFQVFELDNGTCIRANNKMLNKAWSGKEVAIWKEAVKELLKNELVSRENETFYLTTKGYEWAK